jgi:hypothetical protein
MVLNLGELKKQAGGRYFVTAISKTNNESDPILFYPMNVQGSVP